LLKNANTTTAGANIIVQGQPRGDCPYDGDVTVENGVMMLGDSGIFRPNRIHRIIIIMVRP